MKKSHKILLVDDEVAVRNLYQLYFETHGYSIVPAASIGEALRCLRNEDIALALIDIFLHGENGIDLLRGILAVRPDFPVVIISALSADSSEFGRRSRLGPKAYSRNCSQ